MIRSVLACVAVAIAAPSAAETLPPEIQDLFLQLGIELDENGSPVAPEPPANPTPPAAPPTEDEVRATLEMLGIVLDEDGNPVVPEPVERPNPPEPVDPLEFLIELGIDPGVLEAPSEPTPVAVVPSPEPRPIVEPIVRPELPPEILELLGLGDGNEGIITPPVDPVVVQPIEPFEPEDIWTLLGFDGPPGAASSAAVSVPEPTAATLALLAGLTVASKRRR